MQEYNYNSEIWTNLLFFEQAFDDTLVKRYDQETKKVLHSIRVNYQYGPKQRILADLQNNTDTIKLPVVAVTMTGGGRDNNRIKDKLATINYKTDDGQYISLQAIPWNIEVDLTILGKNQEDIDQIVGNFATVCNPYIVFSWREPKSGREVRSKVEWDGQVKYNYPTHGGDMNPDQKWRLEATAHFTIETHLYRTAVENDVPICSINLDVIPTNSFYCDTSYLSAYAANNEKDSFVISGIPQLRWVDNYYLKTGDSPVITVQGDGFNNTFGLFVSGSSLDMYPLTKYYPISGSTEYFYGYEVNEFESPNSTQITFTLPPPSAIGFCDIIAVNSCGWSKLTTDANRCSRVLNPYPTELPDHYSWCVEQYPYLNGLIVSNNLNDNLEINCEEDIIVVENDVIDRDAILEKIRELMELAGITAEDL